MVTKYEVLEYCKNSNRTYVPMDDLIEFFKKKTNTGGVYMQAKILKEKGLVEKYIRLESKSRPINIPEEERYVEVEKGAPGRGRKVYLKLTDEVFDMLDDYDVESFYDLPGAKESNVKLMTKENEEERRRLVELG